MSKLLFRGSDFQTSDANSPNNYDVICSCGALLGALGRFAQNKEGWRSILCPQCQICTLVQGTEIKQAELFKVPRNA